MRLFIAAKLPEHVVRALERAQMSIPAGARKTRDFHPTLAFLGEMGDPKQIIDLLEKLSFPSFLSSLSSPCCFPETGRPRILYVDLTNEQAWVALAAKIRELLNGVVAVDDRFTPHITVGRVKEGECVSAEEWKKTKTEKTEFIVDTVCLCQSILAPQGSVYKELACVCLKKQKHTDL